MKRLKSILIHMAGYGLIASVPTVVFYFGSIERLYEFFLVVIAVTAVAGIVSPFYEDTLLQRIGMSAISFGASLELACKYYECGNGRSMLVMVGGFAIYGTATTIKHWKRARWVRKFGKSMKG